MYLCSAANLNLYSVSCNWRNQCQREIRIRLWKIFILVLILYDYCSETCNFYFLFFWKCFIFYFFIFLIVLAFTNCATDFDCASTTVKSYIDKFAKVLQSILLQRKLLVETVSLCSVNYNFIGGQICRH